jgi:hypothetical protein
MVVVAMMMMVMMLRAGFDDYLAAGRDRNGGKDGKGAECE